MIDKTLVVYINNGSSQFEDIYNLVSGMSEEQLLMRYNFNKWEDETMIALSRNNCFVNLYADKLIIRGDDEESKNQMMRRFEHLLKQEGLLGIKLGEVKEC